MNFGATLNLTPYCDRTAVHSYARFQPYPNGSHSESDSELYYKGYPQYIPRPLSSIKHRLQDENFRWERCLDWNMEWTVAFVVNHLSPTNSPDAAQEFRRIRMLAENLARETRLRDVAYRIFNRLDRILFAGHLKSAVYLSYANLGSEVSGATFTHGHGPNPRVKRISIVLNSFLHQHAKPRDVIASLVHQMIHAFFLVACGPQDEKETGYGRLDHGLHFGKVMETIKTLSGAKIKPLPLDFGHSLGPHYDDYYAPPHRRRRTCNGKWYSSHCHAHVEAIGENDINEWYGAVCHPLLELPESVQKATVLLYNDRHHKLEEVPRSSPTTPPSTESVEFVFQDKTVLIPGGKIDAFSSIRKAVDKTESRYLVIPEEVDEESFMRLLELIHLGRYSPDIGPVRAPGKKGPPIIKPLHHESQPFLLTDVRMFKLGALLGFDEVKGVALERLNSQHVTREDPVCVLKEIYDGADPDPDLRVWVKGFLTKGPETDWLDPRLGIGGGMGGREGMTRGEPPNLVKLDQDMGFKSRFRDLVACSSALHIDVLKAKDFLFAAMGPRAPAYADGVGMGRMMGLGDVRRPSPPLGVGMGSAVRGGLGWDVDYERYGQGYGMDNFIGLDGYY